MVRTWCVVYILACKCALRRSGVQFFDINKWSGNAVFCTFGLANVLRAGEACHFLTAQLPKVVWRWGVLYILTWKCPSGHSGVQIFISPLTTWLRTCRFSEPTFRPSRCTNHEKNTAFRDFRSFCAPVVSFFWLYFSAVLFIWLDFFWLYFSFISPYCRKFDS